MMMSHEKLIPLLESICYMYDYDTSSNIKAKELFERLHPINTSIKNNNVLEGLYAILHYTLELLKEIECINVNTVKEKTLNQKVD